MSAASIHVGRYELVERLGQGSTSEVHLARTVRRDGEIALVALRRPLAPFASDPRFVEELLASAHRAEQLLHPGIARVLEVSSDPRTPYVASEYVHGEQLAAILRRLGPGERPLDVLLRVIALAAEAVEHAHTGRPPLVHGSLTPQNLFIAYDGEVRVSDFGAPRLAIGPEDAERRDHGGVAYWSPEQAAQRMLDAPSDVFSLGVILWECVTQRRLFQAPTRAETRAMVKRAEVPRPGDLTDCPAALERIVMRCLARDPHDRPTTAGALAEDLHELLEKRRRDASPLATRKLLQDLFAQRQAGRDATMRRAMNPSRDSYAPLAASSPSFHPPAPNPTTPLASSTKGATASAELATTPATPKTEATTTAASDTPSREAVAPRAAATTSQTVTLPEGSSTSQTSTLPEGVSVQTATVPDAPVVLAVASTETRAASPKAAPTASTPRPSPAPARAPTTPASAGGRQLALVAVACGLLALIVVVAVRMSSRAEDTGDVARRPVETSEPQRTARSRVTEPETTTTIGTVDTTASPPTTTAITADEPDVDHVDDVADVDDAAEVDVPEAESVEARTRPETETSDPTAPAALITDTEGERATLEVVCRPAAEIFLDNRSLGLTPRVVEIPAGPLAIGLRSTGPEHRWRTIRREVEDHGTLSIAMSECP